MGTQQLECCTFRHDVRSRKGLDICMLGVCSVTLEYNPTAHRPEAFHRKKACFRFKDGLLYNRGLL